MAVFMINICKFNGCGITFPRLPDLIEHIEDVHIDLDPAVVEQKEASQPACIPLSYVLKFFTEATRRELQSMPPVPEVRRRVMSAPKTPSVRSSTPTDNEMDEDEMSPSEDSNDSWTTVEEYSSDYILRYGVKMNSTVGPGSVSSHSAQEKPFACPVPGCKKRYKNINGIKYHSKNGHKKDGKIKKAYKCQCGKNYKTAQGLKSHSISQHIAVSLPPPTEGTGRSAVIAGQGHQGQASHAGQMGQVSHAGQMGQVSHASHAGHVSNSAGLVVTAAPPREGIDAGRLARIYDSLKVKELPKFTIPKHALAAARVTVQAAPSIDLR